MGYVGLPLAVAFAEAGHDVVALDVDRRKVNALRAGRSYIEDVSDDTLGSVLHRIVATTRPAQLARCDAVLVCVPTPLTANREPDLGPLIGATQALASVLQAGQLVVLESTTYPGTTRERVAPILSESGFLAGKDFNLAFSPERVDPGRTDFTMRTTPKVVGGLTEACGERAEALYREVCDTVVRVSTPEAAELTKLLENIFRSVNIALVARRPRASRPAIAPATSGSALRTPSRLQADRVTSLCLATDSTPRRALKPTDRRSAGRRGSTQVPSPDLFVFDDCHWVCSPNDRNRVVEHLNRIG